MTDTDHAAASALERLATALDPARFVTTLITGTGRVPHLTVANRRYAQLAESIYAADNWYWWSWAERAAPFGDVEEAARRIAHVLSTG